MSELDFFSQILQGGINDNMQSQQQMIGQYGYQQQQMNEQYGYPQQQVGGQCCYPQQMPNQYGYPQQQMGGQYGYPQQMTGQYGYPQQMTGQYGCPQQTNMQYGYPQQQMYGNQYGYPQQMMGRIDSYGQVTYRRNEILQGLRDYVVNQTGKPILKEEKIEETPELLRHACVECKVSQLGVCYFTVPEMNLSVPFYFCTACGKLYYLKDFM